MYACVRECACLCVRAFITYYPPSLAYVGLKCYSFHSGIASDQQTCRTDQPGRQNTVLFKCYPLASVACSFCKETARSEASSSAFPFSHTLCSINVSLQFLFEKHW